MIAFVLRWLVPSGVVRRLRARWDARAPHEITPVGTQWPDVQTDWTAWDEMADRLVERWPSFVEACSDTRPLDAAHERARRTGRDISFHNTYMTFGYVLALAAHGKPRLKVLDWGGGLGHYFVLARTLLPDLEIEYHVKDLPRVCERGREVAPEIVFHDSDDAIAGQAFDLVVASGALHCVPDWRSKLDTLALATDGYLLVTRLPIVRDSETQVVQQDASAHGFTTPIVKWFLNQDEFLDAAQRSGLVLIRRFLVDEILDTAPALERPTVKGFLFARRDREAPR